MLSGDWCLPFHAAPSKAMETLLDLPPLQIILEREARWATYRFLNMARESQGTIVFIQNRLVDELQSDEILGMVSDLTPPIQLLTRTYNVLFPNRDEWDKPRNGLLLSEMCWYTDGSKNDKGSGAGIYCSSPKTEIYHSLGKHTTVFQAELYAIENCW